MRVLDNINTKLADELKSSIKAKSKLAIAASSFSIYAFEALRKELEGIEELRFVFTSPSFLQENFKKDVPKFFIPTEFHGIYFYVFLRISCSFKTKVFST